MSQRKEADIRTCALNFVWDGLVYLCATYGCARSGQGYKMLGVRKVESVHSCIGERTAGQLIQAQDTTGPWKRQQHRLRGDDVTGTCIVRRLIPFQQITL